MSIEFYTTDELIDELLSRSKHAIISLHAVARTNLAEGEEWVCMRWKGNLTHCMGATVEMQHLLIRSQRKDIEYNQ